MAEFEFSRWDGRHPFVAQSAERLFEQFTEALLHAGDEELEALQQAAAESQRLLEELERHGWLERTAGGWQLTPRAVWRMQQKALEALLRVRRQAGWGSHPLPHLGTGDRCVEDTRPWQFGDSLQHLNIPETLKNVWQRTRQGPPWQLHDDDLVVFETEAQTRCATALLLDMSGSMGRYGKFAAAKQVALALQALVRARYAGDTLYVIGFATSAELLDERHLLGATPRPVTLFEPRVHLRISLDRPPRFIPQHFTNIHAAFQLARRLLQRHATANRQIILMTDGEPTAHLEGRDLLLIYPPSEPTARATLAEARRCAQLGIHCACYALVEDSFYFELVKFVERLARQTGGTAAYSYADEIGSMVLESFVQGRHRRQPL